MTLNVALHNPTRAEAQTFTFDGRLCAAVDFIDDAGREVTLYTTPKAARAIADAFNSAMAKTGAA